jgi:hypothetical protein
MYAWSRWRGDDRAEARGAAFGRPLPRGSLSRGEEHLVIRFEGLGDEQTMSVSLKYVGAEDEEGAKLMLPAQLQRIGYRVRREA